MRIITAILLMLNLLPVQASHIVGGEIYYDYLGNNNYKFYISVYRDCLSTGAQYDDPLNLAVYTSSGGFVQNVPISFPGSVNVPVVFNNPCVTPPTNICTENATYTTVINLPPTAGGYTITYQRCCRGGNINNITQPDDAGFTLTCVVPGGANFVNSSPRFNDYPPLLLCNNDDLVFDHSATDPDGDELVYSLITPFTGASSVNPAPNPSPPPPYSTVQWVGGFNAVNPLGPGATININSTTGLLTASPNLTGLFVVGIQVEEVRNGVVINRTLRDFLFRVFNCQLQLEAIVPPQEQQPGFISYCQGLDITFANNSYGGTNYAWDFGVPNDVTDVSTVFEPSFTYPQPGIYQATLVINPGWPCTDTAFIDINVNNEIEVSFTIAEDSLCILDNDFEFFGSTTGPAGTTFAWDFGPNADPQTATTQNVADVTFDVTGTIPVTLEVTNNVCVEEVTEMVYVIPEPLAEMVLPEQIECKGLTIDFGNTTQNATNYGWDFGDVNPGPAGTSSAFEPTYTFPGPGTYTVTLDAWSTAACINSTTETFVLNEDLIISFTSEDSLCLTNNSFNFDGTVAGPPHAVYTWNFGPNASISSSNDIDVNDVSFTTTGSIPITLTGTFDDCEESVTQNIYLYRPPTINFAIAPGLQCVPFNAQFIDLSTSETSISYAWDFGDGNTSNLQNPTNLYENVGNFPVTLTIWTTSGCVDTLTLIEPDFVNVRPIPEAGFSVDPDYTDICHSVVHFTDESSGGAQWFYWYDDSTSFGMVQNPSHLYYTDGWHRPIQVVTNEWGCKDTAYSELFIEPFTLYAPTMFTPDGDEFNNTFLPIVYLEVVTWNMKIYNRWGQLMFESNDVDTAWDGTMPNGRMAQVGTYTWKITYVSCEPSNDERIITGHISLDR